MASKIMNLNKIPFNILYVEDDLIVRDLTLNLLEEHATSVFTASNGDEGFRCFENNKIDLIITDLLMPKSDGISLITQVRKQDKKVPVIIISAYDDNKMLHSSIDLGVHGFIMKPVNVSKLLSIIKVVREKHDKKFLNTHHILKPNTNNFLEYGENRLIDYLDVHSSSIVVLIKIEEFRYLNSSLTSKISKKLQKRFAKRLFSHMLEECNFSKIYILERGEFVFAKPYTAKAVNQNFQEEIKKFQERVNSAKIKIGLIDYTLSIMTSLAYGENTLDNAKAGLRNLMHSKHSFIIANELLEKEKEFAVKKLQTFKMLQTAINTYNIVSYFQPIVNNKTEKIEKYESLVRLIDENQNIISPYFFLETAKEGKYYQEITTIVLRNSFRALFETDMGISINLSALDIEEERTQEEFFLLLEKYKTEANRITIELMEDVRITEPERTKTFIDAIKAKGVKVAIDDFGKGFSNFSRVLTYSPDYIKIDGTLIKNIEHNALSRNMVETIVSFSKKEGIQTIAEYVENENIYNILCEIGVDYSQGYYFGKAEVLKRKLY
jgi:EAL domain-containing protein (putative c-di-GMP-specific phosphodiesterase class I)/DNA-binding response OmpR family regulator